MWRTRSQLQTCPYHALALSNRMRAPAYLALSVLRAAIASAAGSRACGSRDIQNRYLRGSRRLRIGQVNAIARVRLPSLSTSQIRPRLNGIGVSSIRFHLLGLGSTARRNLLKSIGFPSFSRTYTNSQNSALRRAVTGPACAVVRLPRSLLKAFGPDD